MNRKTLNFILQDGEGIKTEFKPSLSDINRMIEIVCSFANSKGGTIFVGVLDNGDICGVDIGRQTIERLTNTIVDNLDPKIYPVITAHTIGKKSIISIEVGESHDKPHLAYGKAFIRVGKNTKSMGRSEYEKQLLEKHKHQIQFDKRVCSGATLKDIDYDFITKVFIPKYESLTETKLAGSPQKVLEAFGCIKGNKPANSGILLFGKNPQRFYVNAYIALARYKGCEVGTERLDYKEFNGNIFQQIDECDRYIEDHVAVMSRLVPHKVEREDIPEYPLFSIRELITNAVVHRDYSVTGSKVIIKMFDDRIQFYNPGGLPTGITPKNILKKQFSRNPVLSRVLSKIGYIEEVGEGWDKIVSEHKSHPLRPEPPKIETDEHSVLVEVFSTKEKFGKEKKAGGKLNLNSRQEKAIEYIKQKGRITNKEYRDLCGIGRDTAHRDLKELLQKKVVERAGAGRSSSYRMIIG